MITMILMGGSSSNGGTPTVEIPQFRKVTRFFDAFSVPEDVRRIAATWQVGSLG